MKESVMNLGMKMRLICYYIIYFCVWLGQRCESTMSTGLCQCRAVVCVFYSFLRQLMVQMRCVWLDGFLAPRSWSSSCNANCFKLSHRTPQLLFPLHPLLSCSLSFMYFFLLFSHVTSSPVPRSLCLLRNIQLYVPQLRILIFPTRQRTNQEEERGAGRAGHSASPAFGRSPSLGRPINLTLGFLRRPRWCMYASADIKLHADMGGNRRLSCSMSGCIYMQTDAFIETPGVWWCGHSSAKAKYAHVNETMCWLGFLPSRPSYTVIDPHTLIFVRVATANTFCRAALL